MLVKFFARGTGGGRGPVEYITRKDDPKTKKLRSPAPQILRGNPVITRRLIDELEFKHKYRSGVLSLAPSDAPTEKEIEAVIDSFEKYAFAGLDKDAYHVLWVKHTHTGNNRVELHFVTPRVELYTGKSLNIAPPGWHGYFKPWQSQWNIKQKWARPDDPERKRIYEPGWQASINADREAKGLEPIRDTRKLLTEYVMERVAAGLIANRDEIIDLFQEELGLEITRAGKDYITVLDPETSKRYRLKGKVYEREFRPQPEIAAEVRWGTTDHSTVDSKELRQVTERIRSNYQYRYQYNQKRYGASTPRLDKLGEPQRPSRSKLGNDLDAGQVLARTSPSRIEPLSGYLRRQLGSDALFDQSPHRKTADLGLSGATNQFSSSRIETAATDSRKDPRENRGDNYPPNRERNLSHSADQLNPEGWLAMPGPTLSEIGVDDERTRNQINDRFRRARGTVQAGHDQSLSEIQLGHESAREAEQASSLSSAGLNQTAQGLERANRELERIQQQTALHLPRIRGHLKKKRAQELERFKTEINLVSYAQSQGYEYLKRESPRNSAVLRHNSGDKIVVTTDIDGHGVYFSLRDDADKGTIIDFVQNRRNLSLTEVRKELRDWLQESNTRPSKFRPIAQPKPITHERGKQSRPRTLRSQKRQRSSGFEL